MKYVMLIYQGTALERQAALPEEEQKQVYADDQGINQTPGGLFTGRFRIFIN